MRRSSDQAERVIKWICNSQGTIHFLPSLSLNAIMTALNLTVGFLCGKARSHRQNGARALGRGVRISTLLDNAHKMWIKIENNGVALAEACVGLALV